MGQRMKKIFCGLVVGTVSMAVVIGGFPASAENIKDAQNEKKKLESSLSEAQDLVDSLKNNKKGIEDSVEKLDEQLTDISEKMVSLKKQIKETDQEIEDTEEKLKKAQAKEESQLESMKLRIKYTYENFGSMNYLTLLLSSESFVDFLNYAQYMNMIIRYDRKQLDEYAETRAVIQESEQKLKTDRTKLEQMEQQAKEEQEAVDLLAKEKENQLKQVSSDLSDAEAKAAEFEAEIAAQNEIIAQIQKAEEQRKKEAAAKKESEKENHTDKNQGSSSESGGNISSSDSYTGGEFLWPCPASRRVTSDFGSRPSPTAGASSYHKGIDIGAPYGADIVSAADGVVFTTAYQANGAGNYTVISHGGGLYTVYMHCSSLAVSPGQKVKRGQTIAYVGSTGISTGNHLHFGVQLNGSYVNPWTYLK